MRQQQTVRAYPHHHTVYLRDPPTPPRLPHTGDDKGDPTTSNLSHERLPPKWEGTRMPIYSLGRSNCPSTITKFFKHPFHPTVPFLHGEQQHCMGGRLLLLILNTHKAGLRALASHYDQPTEWERGVTHNHLTHFKRPTLILLCRHPLPPDHRIINGEPGASPCRIGDVLHECDVALGDPPNHETRQSNENNSESKARMRELKGQFDVSPWFTHVGEWIHPRFCPT